MEPVDTLICARWVLPVEPDGRVLADHAVAIRAGRIVAVLPRHEARARFAPAELFERPQHALLPGFVNAHTHAAMTLLRGRAENLPLAPWLQDAIAPIEQRWVDPEYVRDGTELAIAEMLRAGTTCFADMHAVARDRRAHRGRPAHARQHRAAWSSRRRPRWAASPDEYIEKGMALRDEYRGDPLVATHFALEPALLLERRDAAARAPAGRRTRDPGRDAGARIGLGDRREPRPARPAAARAAAAAGPRQPAARGGARHAGRGRGHRHAGRLRRRGRALPGVEPEARQRRLPGRRTARPRRPRRARHRRRGLEQRPRHAVRDAHAPACSRPASARGRARWSRATCCAWRRSRARARSASATAPAAWSPGKWADLCCIDLRTPASWPVHDVATTLVYACSSRQVTDTWVAGRHAVRRRHAALHRRRRRARARRSLARAHRGRTRPERATDDEALREPRNVDPAEIARFDAAASRWWDPQGEMRPLHDLNPVRLQYVERAGAARGPQGARRRLRRRPAGRGDGAQGRAGHGHRPGRRPAAGRAAARARDRRRGRLPAGARPRRTPRPTPAPTTIVTCMEMLEHVPDPAAVVAALASWCARAGTCSSRR